MVAILIIFLLNAGSSSLKFQLIDMKNEKTLMKGLCEKLNSLKTCIKSETFDGRVFNKEFDDIKNHKDAFCRIKELILDNQYGVIKSFSQVSAIGHRVVHGGEYFKEAALVTDDVIEKIKKLTILAPLHNQANLNVIMICKEIFKDIIPQIAVFDTSFYFNIPPKAYMIGVPYKYYEKYNIRKYGFHGTSHKFVSEKCAEIMGTSISNLKIITCHLGSGCSITAIDKGKVIDTSMSFTPLGGIMMGTRCGSLDPSVVTFLQEKEGLDFREINDILNKESGLLGISEVSSDDRDILKAAQEGDKRAILAHEMFDYQITKYLGAYTAAMNGCDAIVFTAGIGENQWEHREKICKNLEFMGIKLDRELNQKMVLGKCGKISSEKSSVSVFVIATNEELEMAREVSEIFKNQCKLRRS